MEENKLSNDVIEQIKRFDRLHLTREQRLLIELKKCYEENGLFKECKQINTDREWCIYCNSKHFKRNFKN